MTSSPTTFESVNPLTDPRWDRWVDRHPAGTIFHTSAWARLLVETYGFHPFYLVERRQDEWVGGLPMMEVRGILGARRGVSLPFTDACPPLLHATPSTGANPSSSTETSPSGNPPHPSPASPLNDLAARHPLLDAAVTQGRRRGWRSLELREATAWTARVPPSLCFHGHLIDLTGGEAAVLSRFSSATRRAIRKAADSPVRYTLGTDVESVRTYFRLHGLTRRRHGLPPQPWPFFLTLQRRVLQPGHGFVATAWVHDRPAASAVFLHHARAALYKFGASDEDFLGLRPNNGVFWEAIRACLARGCETLDLGRTSLGNAGLRRFKQGWGGTERIVSYARFDLTNGRIVPTPDRTSGWTSRVFRRLPAPVANWVGAQIYRFAA